MAAELLGSKWSTMADLTVADGTLLTKLVSDVPGAGSLNNTMGHFCHFAMDGGTEDDYTASFDWPVKSDFTIVINATKIAMTGATNTTLDVGVEGSVDGTNFALMADKTAILADGDGDIDGNMYLAVYDYDAKGRMPYMRLQLTAATPSDSTFLIAIYPH